MTINMYTNKKGFFSAVIGVASCFANLSHADQFYVGLSYFANYAEIDVKQFNQERLEDSNGPINIRSHDQISPSTTVGYQLLPNFAIQATYTHDIRFTNDNISCFIICGVDPDLLHELILNQWDLGARFDLPFGNSRFHGFATAGASLIEERLYTERFSEQTETFIASTTEKTTELSWHAGLGLELRFSKLVGLQLGHQYTDYNGLRRTALTWNVRF